MAQVDVIGYFITGMVRSKEKGLSPVSANLRRIFSQQKWQGQWELFVLARKWSEVVGQDVADQTEPAFIGNNVLWIHVRSSVWMQHIQTLKPRLLDQVRRFLPKAEIVDLRWILQPADRHFEEGADQRTEDRILDPARQKAFEDMAAIVQDKGCRDALCRLWRMAQKKSD